MLSLFVYHLTYDPTHILFFFFRQRHSTLINQFYCIYHVTISDLNILCEIEESDEVCHRDRESAAGHLSYALLLELTKGLVM